MKKRGERRYGTNLCGKRIKLRRKEKNIGQQELVSALEVDYDIKIQRPALVLIEQQKRNVSDYELVAFSRILEVNMEWLLFGDDLNESSK